MSIYMKPKIIAIIPARGGSKTIPRKNIKPFNGKPLIYYAIAEAKKSQYPSRVLVSTEDREIAQIAREYGAGVIPRPLDLAQDDAPLLLALQHVIKYLEQVEDYHPDVIVTLQPTSPLRTAEDIDRAIKKFLQTECDSVVSVCEVEHPPHWMFTLEGDKLKPVIEGGEGITQRQDAPKVYRLNGAVYVTHRDVIIKESRELGNDTRAYIMPPERSIDINTDLDFKLAELLMKERKWKG